MPLLLDGRSRKSSPNSRESKSRERGISGFSNEQRSSVKNPQNLFEIKSNVTVWHEGFKKDDPRQKMVQYAYKLGGYDFMAMIECENGNRNVHAKGDSGEAYGLCQMNKIYHKDIPQAYYDGVWQVQIEYCYQKWKGGTRFYGPTRIIKGVKCHEYIKDRFTYIE